LGVGVANGVGVGVGTLLFAMIAPVIAPPTATGIHQAPPVCGAPAT
jgi:hypothetical protein